MKQVERYFYPAVFVYEEGQEIAVVFPDLNCATSGATDEEALLSARELLGCVLVGLEEDKEAGCQNRLLSDDINNPKHII